MFEAQMAFNGMHPPFFPSSFILGNEVANEGSYNSPLFSSNSQDLGGVGAMVGRRSMLFPRMEVGQELNGDDDLSDDCSAGAEKKRKLNVEQVRTLERNFEIGNKLEPERKMQLARDLGLQPRQIAIWFQNRRARWKTKQLEKDYDSLKHRFEAVKSENEALLAKNYKLQTEILALKGMETPEPINLNKDTEGSCSNTSDNNSDIHLLDISRTPNIETSLDANKSISFFTSYKPAGDVAHELVLCSKIEDGGVPDHQSFANIFSGFNL
ncbi:hypothetical protein J5N97_017222 [Dioscorea zingiberensis]|uniref:Homeobox-leucine zipper protein n=1 Tax=Dioscorea zingiberensis TaxID=325984 RepID=A0A9D5HGD1_9LILI|nr:hypothetical protein J5N97_017222 [Dioscorea zingiberensis]